MERLIDAGKFQESVEGWQRTLLATYGKNDEYVVCIERVLELLEDAPTVDAEPVVRCKDCKNNVRHDHRCGRMNHGFKDDFFCAWGEREEDE